MIVDPSIRCSSNVRLHVAANSSCYYLLFRNCLCIDLRANMACLRADTWQYPYSRFIIYLLTHTAGYFHQITCKSDKNYYFISMKQCLFKGVILLCFRICTSIENKFNLPVTTLCFKGTEFMIILYYKLLFYYMLLYNLVLILTR